MNQTIQSLQLQRLIDGECSSDDIREILTAARNQPWQWEQIALTLLEDRAWQQQLKTTVDLQGNSETLPEIKKLTIELDPPSICQDVSTASKESNPSASTRLTSSLAPTREIPVRSPQMPVSSPAQLPVRSSGTPTVATPTRWNWLVLAASLLIVAMVGYSSGQFFANRNPRDSLVRNSGQSQSGSIVLGPQMSPMDSVSANNATINPVSLNPEFRMQLPGNDRYRLQGEVPLYRVESMDQWGQIGDRIPPGLQLNSQQIENLNSQGVGIEHDVDFLSGSLGEGRVFIVPIRSLRLSPTQ